MKRVEKPKSDILMASLSSSRIFSGCRSNNRMDHLGGGGGGWSWGRGCVWRVGGANLEITMHYMMQVHVFHC